MVSSDVGFQVGFARPRFPAELTLEQVQETYPFLAVNLLQSQLCRQQASFWYRPKWTNFPWPQTQSL